MKRSFKRYSIVGTVLLLLWCGFLAYTYVHYSSYDDVVTEEIRENSRRVGQQVSEIFTWFDAKKEVFITGPQETKNFLPGATTTINGKKLTMAVPLELAHKLENDFAAGMEIRFVSNSPINRDNFPSAEDNNSMLAMAEAGLQDSFKCYDSVEKYHYVRPLFALESCVTCHINTQKGDLLGAVVIDTDPRRYILAQRFDRANLLLFCMLLGSAIIFLLYIFLCRLWRKNAQQGDSLEYSQSMLDNMSHEMEVLLGNVSRILRTLQDGGNTAQNAELLLALQAMNSELVTSAMKLSSDGAQAKAESYEEVFHVETLLQQCLQLFHAPCADKNIQLQLKISNDVPEYVLGDALHLRQVIMRILKESVNNTKQGAVQVRVRAATHMAINLKASDLNHMPIHLVVEVEDSSLGYVVSEEKGLLGNKDTSFSSRATITLKPMAEIAALLQGSLRLAKNKNSGAIFELIAQVKLVSEEKARSAPATDASASSVAKAVMPSLEKVSSSLQHVKEGAKQVQEGMQQTKKALPATENAAGMQLADTGVKKITQELDRASHELEKAQAGLQGAPVVAGARPSTATASVKTSAKTSEAGEASRTQSKAGAVGQTSSQPKPHDVTEEVPVEVHEEYETVDFDQESFAQPEQAISIIIGDCGIDSLSSSMQSIFAQEKVHATLVDTADAIFKIVDAKDHTIDVVFLRMLKDLDATFTATRIRYLEQMGSRPVAVVLIAEDIVDADLDVLRFFNISTVDNFPRDAQMAAKVARMALRTQSERIFQGGKLLAKTVIDGDKNKLFDVKMAMENSKKDRTFIRNMCSMWVRFYPEQVRRLRQVIRDGEAHDVLRIMRSVKNSAGTVGLPMLFEECCRLETKMVNSEEARFEKLFSVYEQTYEFLKKHLDWQEEK